MSTNLVLTTVLRPTKKFTVDGAEYQLFDMDHLTPEQESKALALFARFSNIATDLDTTSVVLKGQDLADRLRTTREQIIEAMTDLPISVVKKLPLSQQSKLVEAMQEEMEDAPAAPEDEPAVVAGDGE